MGAGFALEVVTELHPVPFHPFPFRRCLVPAPGPPSGDWRWRLRRSWLSRLRDATGKGPLVSSQCPHPIGMLWLWPQSHGADPSGYTAADPPIVHRFLPPQRHGRIGRKINSRLSGLRSLRPSSPPLLPRGHGHAAPPGRGRAARHTSGSIPRGGQAGPGLDQGWSKWRGRGAAVPMGTTGINPWGRQWAPALCPDQIRGRSGAARGDQIRALLFLYSRKRKKKRTKKKEKKIHFMFFQPPALSLALARRRPRTRDGPIAG